MNLIKTISDYVNFLVNLGIWTVKTVNLDIWTVKTVNLDIWNLKIIKLTFGIID